MKLPGSVLLWLTALAAFSSFHLVASEESSNGLFTSQRTMQVEIAAPWRKVTRKRGDEPWPATLSYTDSGGQSRTVKLTVERRGISRQKICDFPPIRLRFDKESIEGTPFEGEGALKLVTHCDDGTRWTQYNVLEMLAYRIFNLITDQSFRVRPLALRYRDVERDREPEEQFGFVIEDVDEVADRFDMQEIDTGRISPNQLEPTATSRMALFQYLVGNLDWSALTGPDGVCCHNAKLIGSSPESGVFIPVPYDFDATGFVDAHYAAPPEGLKVRSVRNRLFRGYCTHNDTLPEVRSQFLGIEADILALVQSEPRLSDSNRRSTLSYLENAFAVFRDDEAFEEEIVSACRGRG